MLVPRGPGEMYYIRILVPRESYLTTPARPGADADTTIERAPHSSRIRDQKRLDAFAGLTLGIPGKLQMVALNELHDVVKRDLVRSPGQGVPTLFSPPARDKSAVPKLAQNLHQVVRRTASISASSSIWASLSSPCGARVAPAPGRHNQLLRKASRRQPLIQLS